MEKQPELRKALLEAAALLEKSASAGNGVEEAARMLLKDAIYTTTSGAFGHSDW
jgi:hypothetical protein